MWTFNSINACWEREREWQITAKEKTCLKFQKKETHIHCLTVVLNVNDISRCVCVFLLLLLPCVSACFIFFLSNMNVSFVWYLSQNYCIINAWTVTRYLMFWFISVIDRQVGIETAIKFNATNKKSVLNEIEIIYKAIILTNYILIVQYSHQFTRYKLTIFF